MSKSVLLTYFVTEKFVITKKSKLTIEIIAVRIFLEKFVITKKSKEIERAY